MYADRNLKTQPTLYFLFLYEIFILQLSETYTVADSVTTMRDLDDDFAECEFVDLLVYVIARDG